LNAAAALISESGLAAVTLEAIATRADCAVHSLYMAFGSRDELLRIVFERHSPIPDFEDALDIATDDLTATVRSLYQALAAALGREPRVAPAILAEMFARPASPTVQTLTQHAVPRMLDVLGSWLNAQVRQGRIRDLPMPLLIQQLMGPMVMHMLFRPALSTVAVVELPDLDTVCTELAVNFVRAMAAD
jgi:AcrR family transcriptional regulator